jgi:hypothetical protein
MVAFLDLIEIAGREIDLVSGFFTANRATDDAIQPIEAIREVQKGLLDLGAAIGRGCLEGNCSEFTAEVPLRRAAQTVQKAIEQIERLPAVTAFYFVVAIEASQYFLSFFSGIKVPPDDVINQSCNRIFSGIHGSGEPNGQSVEFDFQEKALSHKGTSARSIDDEKLQRALDFITKNPEKKARSIAKHIGIAESTFMSNYVPALRRRGVRANRDCGYYVESEPEGGAT